MPVLTQGHRELFRRTPDEQFETLRQLHDHCAAERDVATEHWIAPQNLVVTSDLTVAIDDNPDVQLNDWSFSQLCRVSGVNRETVNRVTPKTASRIFRDTIPESERPIQFLTGNNTIRSVHGMAYTRLWNVELLDLVHDVAGEFRPPQKASGGGTGLYCGGRTCSVS